MTTLAALHQDGQTWIGADSRQTNCGQILPNRNLRKWMFFDGWAIGHAGDSRAADLIAGAHTTKPMPKEAMSAHDVANWLREILVEGGFNSDKEEGAPVYRQHFIIATEKACWDVGSCFSLSMLEEGYLHAIGSGAQFAIGAGNVEIQQQPGMPDPRLPPSPRQRIGLALEAACKYDAYSGGDLFVQCLPNTDD